MWPYNNKSDQRRKYQVREKYTRYVKKRSSFQFLFGAKILELVFCVRFSFSFFIKNRQKEYIYFV